MIALDRMRLAMLRYLVEPQVLGRWCGMKLIIIRHGETEWKLQGPESVLGMQAGNGWRFKR
jgi:hypothetical protein